MKLHASFLLPLLASSVSAAPEASAYILQGQQSPSNDASPPALSPSEARFILAQRLGVSIYHGIGSTDNNALKYINEFGGQVKSLFSTLRQDKVPELVMIVDGVSKDTAGPLLDAWPSIKPAFTISNPPSVEATQKLVEDLHLQLGQDNELMSGWKQECALSDAINPFADKCWNGKSKIIHLDLNKKSEDHKSIFERLARFASKSEMNVLVVMMPSSRSGSTSYGTYAVPPRWRLSTRQLSEEPMTDSSETHDFQAQASKSSRNNNTIKTTLPFCHASLDACISSTNNCSSAGSCYKKYSADSGDCFSCKCNSTLGRGGSACQKQDISSPFWLIFLSSFVLLGLVTWGIGMLYSIGDEKLPGVIGAGVSSSKSR